MTSTVRRSLLQTPWFLGALLLCALLQLAFNQRLLALVADLSGRVTADDLQQLEWWARGVSGLGLALLLMRLLEDAVPRRWLVPASLVLGLLGMWHAQKWLVDTLVERADPPALQLAWQAQLRQTEAAKGRIEVRGVPLLEQPVSADLRPVLLGLWPAMVMGLEPEEVQVTSGAAQLALSTLPPSPEPERLRQAYRKAVVVPVALGLSLLVVQINIALGAAALLLWPWRRAARARWLWAHRALTAGLLAVLVAASLLPHNELTDAQAYTEVLAPALWQDNKALALLVDWSLHAEPLWNGPAWAWVGGTR